MKAFISSHDLEQARIVKRMLQPCGWKIISTWHEVESGSTFKPTKEFTHAERQAIAKRDLDEVEECDALFLVAGDEKYSGGKFVEVGYALGLGKKVFVIGRRENMLMWSEQVIGFDSFYEFEKRLSGAD